MATANPFDLLGDDDTEDPSQLLQKIEPKKALAPSAAPKHQPLTKPSPAAANAKLPSKPLPPAQAVREAKSDSARGGRGGRGYGRGRGYNRDSTNIENSFGNMEISGGEGASGEADTRKPFERRDGFGGPRGPYGGGRRGGFSNGEVREGEQERPHRVFDRRSGSGPYGGGRRGGFSNGEVMEGEQERPHRVFDRRSGSGQGNEIKREGAGPAGGGNWGAQTEELAEVTVEVVNEGEKNYNAEKPSGEEDAAHGNKGTSVIEIEEKEPEVKEMTLDEYEKVLEEKRKAIQDLKTEERKVDVKEFVSMQQLANKKNNDDIFIKLGSFKDKKKELAEKEERAKKSVSINEFLKPAEGEKYHTPGGRGRGRGRGSRGGYNGGGEISNVKAPAIEDPGQFPTLGGN